ncbi:MAG TPA: hypothetical protein VEK07_01355 [Polyangiaceae bacterium]|nr:hypothetical protein [Polyangiaceae bacterium]
MEKRAEQMQPRLLFAFAIGLTLLRLLDLRTAPFINDEPALQLMIDQHRAAHTVPTHGLEGTRGVVYGPTALWLYMPVRFLTDSVTAITGAHALAHCAGLILVFLAVERSAGLVAALWTWLLLGASPYLFFYSRLPWDNTFLIPLGGLVLFLLSRLESEPGRAGVWVGLGVACGLIFDLHLMALPEIAAVGVTAAPIAWRSRRSRSALAGMVVGVLAAGGVVAPYLGDVAGTLLRGSHFTFTTEGLTDTVPETLQAMRRYLSADGMDYFLDRTNEPVRAALGPLVWGSPLGWVVAFAGLGCLVAATSTLLHRMARPRPGGTTTPIVARFGIAFFWLFLLYYFGVRPSPFHPHYVIATFWILPFFAAWSLQHLPRPGRMCLQGVIGLLAACDLAFVVVAHAQISRNHGTRGFHYSSIPEEVSAATGTICRTARAAGRSVAIVDLRRVPGVLPPPFQWFDRHLSDCAGVDLVFSAFARRPSDPAFGVFYGDASAYDARLHVLAR